jgi:hypothetical protein
MKTTALFLTLFSLIVDNFTNHPSITILPTIVIFSSLSSLYP